MPKKELKIYTRTGDKGRTALIGGTRVPKYSLQIEAYGTVDELNSFIGLLRDQDIDHHVKKILGHVQVILFNIESHLAADSAESLKGLPQVAEDDILTLENEIDSMNDNLPALRHFILPGGHILVSHCHVARTVCRRAERIIVHLAAEREVDALILKYVNRLSDYLFVLARKLAKDHGAEEIQWKPK
ncbi:MAG: cob(I)yrinic acid a,c-diamide adenosyltransferase [Bacteroidota bacterium]